MLADQEQDSGLFTEVKDLLDPLDLGGELAGVPGADVGLHDQADARRALGDGVDAALDDGHHLLPFSLDGREHGRRLVGKAGFAHDPDGGGHSLRDGAVGLVGCLRGDGKREEHVTRLADFSRPPRRAGRGRAGGGWTGSGAASERVGRGRVASG